MELSKRYLLCGMNISDLKEGDVVTILGYTFSIREEVRGIINVGEKTTVKRIVTSQCNESIDCASRCPNQRHLITINCLRNTEVVGTCHYILGDKNGRPFLNK